MQESDLILQNPNNAALKAKKAAEAAREMAEEAKEQAEAARDQAQDMRDATEDAKFAAKDAAKQARKAAERIQDIQRMVQFTGITLPQERIRIEQECLALDARREQYGKEFMNMVNANNALQAAKQSSQILSNSIGAAQQNINGILEQTNSILPSITSRTGTAFNAAGIELGGIISAGSGISIPNIPFTPTFPTGITSGMTIDPTTFILHANEVYSNEEESKENNYDENELQRIQQQINDYFTKYYDLLYKYLPAYIEAVRSFNENLDNRIFKLNYITQIISDQLDKTRVVTIAQIENNIGQAQANAIVERERVYELYDNEEDIEQQLNIINKKLVTELDNNTTILQLLRQLKNETSTSSIEDDEDYIDENLIEVEYDDESEEITEREQELEERNTYINELIKENNINDTNTINIDNDELNE